MPESIELGSAVGVIRAMDADIGENAEMDYRIIGSDGPGMFDIATNRSTQDGVIVLRKVRDFAPGLVNCWPSFTLSSLFKCSSDHDITVFTAVSVKGEQWRFVLLFALGFTLPPREHSPGSRV